MVGGIPTVMRSSIVAVHLNISYLEYRKKNYKITIPLIVVYHKIMMNSIVTIQKTTFCFNYFSLYMVYITFPERLSIWLPHYATTVRVIVIHRNYHKTTGNSARVTKLSRPHCPRIPKLYVRRSKLNAENVKRSQ